MFGASARGDGFTLEHYRALIRERAFWIPLRNSFVIASITTAAAIVLGSCAAYAVARLRVRGRSAILAVVLGASMFPQIAIVSALYLVLGRLGLIDTIPGLVVPYLTFALPLAVWLLAAYFRRIPAHLEEAAMVDGASRIGVLRRVVLPLAAPGLAATALLVFLACWNEFLFALCFTLGPERHTVPVAIAHLRGQHLVPWGQVLAMSVVATAPLAALVLLLQRRIVDGLLAGGTR
jgi:ABC-type glycerol-3-phosphate transport system permease component